MRPATLAPFGLLALVPTGAALYFLRPYRPFWTVLAAVGLCVAITGAAAAPILAPAFLVVAFAGFVWFVSPFFQNS